MLQPDRAARMVAQYAVDQALPGLGEVIDRLTKATFDQPTTGTYEAEVRRAIERVLVDRVTWLASASPNSQVRAIASFKLQKLAARLRAEVGRAESDQAQHTLIAADIKRFLERPAADRQKVIPASPAPPGAPIGDMGQNWLGGPTGACGMEIAERVDVSTAAVCQVPSARCQVPGWVLGCTNLGTRHVAPWHCSDALIAAVTRLSVASWFFQPPRQPRLLLAASARRRRSRP